jgi:hypothetical protein
VFDYFLYNNWIRNHTQGWFHIKSGAVICILHITGASSPLLSGPLAMLPPILDSPVRLSDNNNLQHSPVMPFGTRAMTLPEISGMNMSHRINWELRLSLDEEVHGLYRSCVVVIRVVKCWWLRWAGHVPMMDSTLLFGTRIKCTVYTAEEVGLKWPIVMLHVLDWWC